ncbi:MAG: prepilin peptidase [Candidatus Vogelbacteria bacterium]|nr:prepilin peptidase [Candidatus Vogelbacteria bacterium]
MIFFVFTLGLIVGSFLNVVIYRYNTGRTMVRGRSRCLACGGALTWYELLPLVSWFVQRGRCRRCRSHVSWQYPLVELLTGALFALVWSLGLSIPLTTLYLIIVSLLVVITVYDLRHKIIPDGFVYGFDLLALVALVWRGQDLPLDLTAGATLFFFFWLLWFVSRGRWIGFGDAKLALGVGWLLGWRGGLSALMLAFWIGALVGVGLIVAAKLRPGGRAVTMKSEIPFAPFIILGLVLSLFFQLNVVFW